MIWNKREVDVRKLSFRILIEDCLQLIQDSKFPLPSLKNERKGNINCMYIVLS